VRVFDGGLPLAATLAALSRQRDDVAFNLSTVDTSSDVAVAAATGNEPYIAYLHEGTRPDSGWLSELLHAAEKFQAGVAIPQTLDARRCPIDGSEGHARFTQAVASYGDDGSLFEREVFARRENARVLFVPTARTARVGQPGPQIAFGPPTEAVVFVDTHLPLFDRDGGSSRLWHLLTQTRLTGRSVTFIPLDGRTDEPYATALSRAGVELLVAHRDAATIARRLASCSVAWLSRPESYEAYAQRVREENPVAGVIYDSVDLHHVRLRRHGELGGAVAWEAMQGRETAAARGADIVVAVSPHEADALRVIGAHSVAVVPTICEIDMQPAVSFDRCEGVVFLGNYDHEPNVDAAQYLCTQIMPRVWERLPDVRLTLIGNNPGPAIRRLASARVVVAGYCEDLPAALYGRRLMLAPLRFGAGLKAKITQSFASGLPVIATTIAAEGFTEEDATAMRVADGTDPFADAVIAAYENRDAWEKLAAAARDAATRYTPSTVSSEIAAILARAAGSRSTLPSTPR
jgi:glycosyltransferase involved in cell wall biosynthesis